MIIAASREICDGEVVFVGMRLPMMAFGVARLTHAPNAVRLIRVAALPVYEPAADILYTMADPANQKNAAWADRRLPGSWASCRAAVSTLASSAARKSTAYGNVNTSYISASPAVQRVSCRALGGAADIAGMAKRLLVIMNHDPTPVCRTGQLDITSPRLLERWRTADGEAGLPRWRSVSGHH